MPNPYVIAVGLVVAYVLYLIITTDSDRQESKRLFKESKLGEDYETLGGDYYERISRKRTGTRRAGAATKRTTKPKRT